MNRVDLTIIVFLLCIMMLLTGCYGQYKAEREFWLTNRKYERILGRVDSTTSEEFEELIVDLRKLVISYPSWPYSALAQLRIGNLYNIQGKYDKALSEYKKVIEDFPSSTVVSAEALFVMGTIYQRKNDEQTANKYFDRVQQEYPDTLTALNIPLYLARYYKSKGRIEESNLAYDEAIQRYKTVINKAPDETKAILVLDYLVNCYNDREKWNEAIVSLRNIANRHPESASAQKALLIIARIYETKLKDKQKADAVYQEIIDKFPDTPLQEALTDYFDKNERGNVRNSQ